MMILAVTGKGGAGKTSIAAGLARAFARLGKRVIAIDMDPSPNLIYSLECSTDENISDLTPLVNRADFIEERTGAPAGVSGVVFRINPDVSDVLEKFGIPCNDGVRLLILGAIRSGGSGCYCPANTLAKRLIGHLSSEADILVMDMEAGVEHLGRGTTRSAQVLLVIVEPGIKSITTATQIAGMAKDLGIPRILGVLNKVRPSDNPEQISSRLAGSGIKTIFSIPYDPVMEIADRAGKPVSELPDGKKMVQYLDELAGVIERNI